MNFNELSPHQKLQVSQDRLIREMVEAEAKEKTGTLGANDKRADHYSGLIGALDRPAAAGKRELAYKEAAELLKRDEEGSAPISVDEMDTTEDIFQPHTEEISIDEVNNILRREEEKV